MFGEDVLLTTEHRIDKPLGSGPQPEDVAVIKHRPRIFPFQVLLKRFRQKRIIVDGVGLAEDIGIAVQKLLEPVVGMLRVECPVKAGIILVQSAFQKCKHILRPVRYLIAVAVLEGSASKL